jgi:hypothetical protein
MGPNEQAKPDYLSSALNSLLGLLLLIAVPFFFFTSTQFQYQHRLSPFLWNIGHILFFFVSVWLALNLYKLQRNSDLLRFLIGTNFLVILLGLGIEIIQQMQGRQFSFEDMYKNCLGASLAIVFHPKLGCLNKITQSTIRLVVSVLTIMTLLPLVLNIVDWIYGATRFPTLSDFETPFETERWIGKGLTIVELEANNHALVHRFDTARYSNLSLAHFPANWLGYECFKFRIFNPNLSQVPLTIRINDQQHDGTTQSYSDRFNDTLDILSGWNQFIVNLDAVRNAPRARSMDMSQIKRIIFFTSRLDQEVTMYFDDLELNGEESQCTHSKAGI